MRHDVAWIGRILIALALVAGCAQGSASVAPASVATASVAPAASPPQPSVVMLAAPCLDEHRGACRGPLAPGTFISILFDPRFAYTVPEGWENPDDDLDTFALWPAWSARSGRPIGEASAVYFFRDPIAASQDPLCEERAEPGIGTSAADLVAWMEGLPALSVTDRAPVSIGGLEGFTIDVRIAPGATARCPWSDRAVPLFTFGRGHYWAILGETSMRLAFLDVTSGGTVLIDIEAVTPNEFARLAKEAQPIIRSLTFATT